MKMNEQCKTCMHSYVCAYKAHYEDAVKLYEKTAAECEKYPYFKFKIDCVQYRKDSYFNQPIPRSVENGNNEST